MSELQKLDQQKEGFPKTVELDNVIGDHHIAREYMEKTRNSP